MRTAEITRNTNETKIYVYVDLDGTGKSEINSGNGFFDHMLTLFAKHGRFDLTVNCDGDTEVDFHHSAEDIGIALGKAFSDALGDRRGITRYGYMILAMDESLILSSVDISGRVFLNCDLDIPRARIGTFDTELVEEFWYGFVRSVGMTLHIKQLEGKNAHHIVEGTFKSVAWSLKKAVRIDSRFADEIPSTKGVL